MKNSKKKNLSYYKILKDNKEIGIGKTDSSQLPIDNHNFKFVKITEKAYNKLKENGY